MAVDEAARRALHNHLEDLLGEQHAETLMAHLRAVGTGELVTRPQLDQRLELTEQRILAQLNTQTRTLVFSLLAANATLAGLVFAAVKFV